jgi:lysophospholipase L1-like esterase
VRAKIVLFSALVNAAALMLLLGGAEFAARWRVEGSARAAFASFVARSESADWLVRDPDLGYKLNPHNEGTNALGIRHAELAPGKPAQLFRVIVVGDSVAFDPSGFVGLLRQRVAKVRSGDVEVINASVPGYTTYQERRLLERDLMPLQPDLVIVQYCVNDNHRFLHELSASGQWLITKDAEHALAEEGPWPANFLPSSRLLGMIRLRLIANRAKASGAFPWDTRADVANAWRDETWPDLEDNLRIMRDRVTSGGGRFAVLAIPFGPQLQQEFLDRDTAYTLKPQRRLAEACARLETPLLDLYQAFVSRRDRRLFHDGIHLTPEGHEIVAAALVEFLHKMNSWS